MSVPACADITPPGGLWKGLEGSAGTLRTAHRELPVTRGPPARRGRKQGGEDRRAPYGSQTGSSPVRGTSATVQWPHRVSYAVSLNGVRLPGCHPGAAVRAVHL